MSGRPWLETLKGRIKEDVLDTEMPTEYPWKSYPRKGAKALSVPFCTFCTPATLRLQDNLATERGGLYER